MGVFGVFKGKLWDLVKGNVWEILRSVVSKAAAEEVADGIQAHFQRIGPEGRERLAAKLVKIADLLRADKSGKAAAQASATLVGELEL
ncbi:MAG: hypothetical protein ACK47B_10880 [Armatimonadota bacterium]